MSRAFWLSSVVGVFWRVFFWGLLAFLAFHSANFDLMKIIPQIRRFYYYHRVDASVDGLVIPKSIIRPVPK